MRHFCCAMVVFVHVLCAKRVSLFMQPQRGSNVFLRQKPFFSLKSKGCESLEENLPLALFQHHLN